MDSGELRKKFIDFFRERGHKELQAASLIPENDPSVLFTTAGMQQFKRFYTYPEEAPAKNVVTIQPCLRTSDIELVGDETHLTFFEMLGNFSFGGYFKKKTIELAYEFLTKELGINPERIMCSIFAGDDKNPRDEESSHILQNIGIKFEEHGRDDNFWGPTGNEGPCGPTVEFYVDGVEVWNLVFNEYYFKDGKYEPLKTKGVDTGLGLERMLVVLNDLKDVYETDVFKSIIEKIQNHSDKKYADFSREFRIIVDHLKAAAFIASEKIEASNLGRGYVLRRLIRRAVRRGKTLGTNRGFIVNLGSTVIDDFKKSYPQLEKNKDFIIDIFQAEEEKFQKPLDWVQQYKNDLEMAIRHKVIKKIKDVAILSEPDEASGEYIYENYQTYGVPPDLSQEIAKDLGLKVDYKGYEKAIEKHKERSRTTSRGMFKGGLVGQSEITTRMHTATHLLLKALQEVLGPDVHQRGSNINEERIRFDFSYDKPVTDEQIKKVEKIVNEKISEDIPVSKKETKVEEAKKFGAEAQFIEKYVQYGKLTMYSIGNFSHELCGGPHVQSTGEIGKFKIIKEESSSAGVRRIRAVLE